MAFQEVKKPPAPKQTLVDRVVGYFDPVRGARRMKARGAIAFYGGMGGYFGPGGRRNRPGLAGSHPGASDADGDIAPDLVDLRAYSRDLARRNAIAGGTISNVVTNVVGTGLAVQPAIDAAFLGLSEEEAKAWKANTLREWRLFCESPTCDITGEQNFYELQALAFRAVLESGDILVLTPTRARAEYGNPYLLALQLIEADRICNENGKQDTDRLVQGVETDDVGAVKRYHIADQHPGARRRAGRTWTKIDKFGDNGRRNALHLFDRRRPGQTRGVPYLAAVIEPLKQLGRYTEAELSAAVINAAFAMFIRMDAEAFRDLFNENEQTTMWNRGLAWDGEISTAATTLDNPGKMINLLPGEEPVAPDMKRPNKEFDPFFISMCKQIGVGLELPVEVILKSFNSSYSAARAALLDAWRFYRTRRDWLATRLCQPVYELWLEEAVATRRIAAPGFFADPAYRKAWSAATWVGDGPGSIDPAKEIDAAVNRIIAGISTVAAESLLHDGVDWETKIAQRKREIAAFADAGMPPLGGSAGGANGEGGGGNGAPPKRYPSDSNAEYQQRFDAWQSKRPASGATSSTHDAAPGESFGDQLMLAMAHRLVHDKSPAADYAPNAAEIAALAAAVSSLATREIKEPRIDLHVAPEIHNHLPSPNVDVNLEAVLPAQAAPIVENHVHVPQAAAAEVQRMEIISMPNVNIESMPTRETESTVERDAKGNIVRTKQSERDAE